MKQLIAGVALLLVSTSMSIAADAPFKCEGEVWTIRKSQIVPGGTLDGFMKAVADNNAWYVAHGVKGNVQHGGQVFTFDREKKTGQVVKDTVVTVHVNVPKDENLPRGDDAWKAFVAEYKANSKILEEIFVCMAAPK